MATVTGEPSWKWRRLVVLVSSALCFLGLAYMIDRSDTELNQTIASGFLWLLGVLILGYCGFATVQDVAAIITTRTGRPYATTESTPAPGDNKTVTIVTDPVTPPDGFAQ